MNIHANLPDYTPLGATVGRATIPAGLPTMADDRVVALRAILARLAGADRHERPECWQEVEAQIMAWHESQIPRE